jgi:polygalacturonase
MNSHGISVGSLGQYYGVADIVSDILVKNISMINVEHGARIKVFPGSNDTQSVAGGGTGYVRNIVCAGSDRLSNQDSHILYRLGRTSV